MISIDGAYDSAVTAIYSAASDPRHWPQALEKIGACFDGSGAAIKRRLPNGRWQAVSSPNIEAATRSYVETWWREDIRAQRCFRLATKPNDGVYTDDLVMTHEEIATLPFYQNFLAQHDLCWFAAGLISHPADVVETFSLQRARAKGPYNDVERKLIATLLAHLQASRKLSTRVQESAAFKNALSQALDHMGVAAFILDAQGRMVFANFHATEMLNSVFEVSDGRLAIGSIAERQKFDQAIESVLRGQSLGPKNARTVQVSTDRHGGRIALHFSPVDLPLSAIGPPQSGDVRISLICRRMDQKVLTDLESLKVCLGLTLAEARLTAFIAGGRTPRETAAELNISEATVRVVLKRIFWKTGVSRQSELVRLIERMMLQ